MVLLLRTVGSYIGAHFTFSETAKLFSKAAVSLFNSTTTNQVWHWFMCLSKLNNFSPSHCSHSHWCAVLPHSTFNLILGTFSGAYLPPVYSLGWHVWFKSFAFLFTWVVCFIIIQFWKFCTYSFDVNSFSKCFIGCVFSNYFSHSVGSFFSA